MPITRFDRPGNYDFNMEHYVPKEFMPNFEALDSILTQFQTEKDGTEALLNNVPEHIKQDTKALNEYVKGNQEAMDALTNSYMSGNLSAARADQAKLLKRVRRDYQPGGKATKFESRKKQLGAIMKEFEDKYKDDPSYQKAFALAKLNSSINPNKIDEAISDPNVAKFFDISKELDDGLKGFKSDKGTATWTNGRYIYKESGEEVTEEDIHSYVQSQMNQPRYREQMKIEAWERLRSTDKAQFKADWEREVDGKLQSNLNQLNGLEAKALQHTLNAHGIKTTVDGVDGPKTRAGKAKLEKMIRDKADKQKASYNFDSAFEKNLYDVFATPLVEKHAFLKTDKSMKGDPYGLISARKAASKSLMDYNKLIMPTPQSILTASSTHQMNMKDLKKVNESTGSALNASVKELDRFVKASPLGDLIGENNVENIYKDYQMADSKEDFVKNSGLAGETAGKVWDILSTNKNAASLQERIDNVNHTRDAAEKSESVMSNVRETYTKTADGSKFWTDNYEDLMKDADFKAIAENLNIDDKDKFLDYVSNAGNVKELEDLTKSAHKTETFTLPSFTAGGGSSESITTTSKFSRVLDKFNRKVDDHYANKPLEVQTYQKITALKGHPAYEGNKLLTEAYISDAGRGFSNIGGGKKEFYNPDKQSQTRTSDEVDVKDVSILVGPDGDLVFSVTGVDRETKAPMVAETQLKTQNGNRTVAQYGGAMVANSYDSNNTAMTHDDAAKEREAGAYILANGMYGGKMANLEDVVGPSKHKTTNIPISVAGKGKYVQGGMLEGVTPSATRKLTSGKELNIYSRYNDLGDVIYNVTKVGYDGNGVRHEVLVRNPGGSPMEIKGKANLKSTVNQEIAQDYNEKHGEAIRQSASAKQFNNQPNQGLQFFNSN